MDNKQNNFWQSEKGKAAIKLALWMIFIVILIIIVLVSERDNIHLPVDDGSNVTTPEPEPENYEFVNYNDMLDTLLLDNYEYTYTITTDSNKYIYTGWKNENKEIGFREDNTGIIKYYKDDVNTYKVNLDTPEVIADLYSGFDSSYIDLHLLFENLSEYLYSVNKDGSTRTINYDKSGYQVVVTTNTEYITNITITVDTTSFDLEFTNIGECATIDFTA